MHNVRLHYALWEDLPSDVQALFIRWMGDDAARGEAFYTLYFTWYNLVHELVHILRWAYGTRGSSDYGEETACNDVAVAYWRARGEAARLSELRTCVTEALSRLEDPIPAGPDRATPEARAAYFDTVHHSVPDPDVYGHYQFSMVLAALDKDLGLTEALHDLITPMARSVAATRAAPYPAVNTDLPPRIVADARDLLATAGVTLPEIAMVRIYEPSLQRVDWDWD